MEWLGNLFGLGQKQQPQQPAPPPQPQQQDPGFFGGIMNMLGGIIQPFMPLLMPLLVIGGIFMAATGKLNGVFDSLGKMISPVLNSLGLGGDDKEKTNASTTQPSGTSASSQDNTTEQSKPAAKALRPANLDAVDFSGNPDITENGRTSNIATVDSNGMPISGNNINVQGDSASITKSFAATLVDKWAQEGKYNIPKDFIERVNNEMITTAHDGKKPLMQALAENSSNVAADRLLELTAKQMGVSKEKVIDRANAELKEMGFRKTTLANFSGLPDGQYTMTNGQKGYFREGAANLTTAYEAAVLTENMGNRHPNVKKFFDSSKNKTGMGKEDLAKNIGADVAALVDEVKTGTALGVKDRDTGASKSFVANTDNGATAGIEIRQEQWYSDIKNAVADSSKESRYTVADASSTPTSSMVVAQGNKPENGIEGVS